MKRSLVLITPAILVLALSSGCSGTFPPETGSIVVVGQVRIVGNTPFQRPVLTTADNNSYVLVADEGVVIRDLLVYRVTGRLYADEWNGMRRAHIEVDSAESVQ